MKSSIKPAFGQIKVFVNEPGKQKRDLILKEKGLMLPSGGFVYCFVVLRARDGKVHLVFNSHAIETMDKPIRFAIRDKIGGKRIFAGSVSLRTNDDDFLQGAFNLSRRVPSLPTSFTVEFGLKLRA